MKPCEGRADMTQHQRFDMDQVQGIYRYMYTHVGNREEAEALTEQAFLQALHGAASPSAATLSTPQSMDTPLWRAAAAVVSAYLGQFYAGCLVGSAIPCAPDASGATELTERILAQLAPHERDILTSRLLQNHSLGETAASMRISAQAALALQWSALRHASQIAAQITAPRAASHDAVVLCGTDTQEPP